jgi:hypothetical protein
VWSAPRDRSAFRDIGAGVTTDIREFDFDSYDELADWLREAIGDDEELEKILEQVEEEIVAQACLSSSALPSSVNVTQPFFFKVVQFSLGVTVGDCGLIICSTLGFNLAWDVAPQGGGLFFGPFPSNTRGQVCQGGSASTKAFLILTRGIPNGSYRLKFSVIGFGGVTSTTLIPINISR